MSRTLVALVAALALSACGTESTQTEEPAAPAAVEPAPEPKAPEWAAPASTRDPAACADATKPTPVDTATLEAPALPEGAHAGLSDKSKAPTDTAPDLYKVKFETTEGEFIVEVHRDWAPIGADHFYNLVQMGYYDDVRFFRNIAGFMVQFGVSGYPEANKVWSENRIQDEPVVQGNQRGIITFAKCGMPNCRSTQVFINHKDNSMLDPQGFSGFGRVVEGMGVVDKLYDCYGEGAPRGMGPSQGLTQSMGNAYLNAGWPNMSSVTKATIIE
ncbi:MAG: peptidylprolyl isomerase [Proteobacteria bacterium]|nr:peptidylprolyl isomerase [Pseudomonadota bacterium]